jgi:hypothetical protein
MDVAVHLAGPFEEAPKAAALSPEKLPELEKTDLRHFEAGIRFHTPEQIGTAPRREAVAASRIPEEAQHKLSAVSSQLQFMLRVSAPNPAVAVTES